MISDSDDDWMELVENLWKSRKNREWISRILGQEGADDKTFGIFYKAVVQEVLLLRSKTWVIITCIGRTLRGFTIGWSAG